MRNKNLVLVVIILISTLAKGLTTTCKELVEGNGGAAQNCDAAAGTKCSSNAVYVKADGNLTAKELDCIDLTNGAGRQLVCSTGAIGTDCTCETLDARKACVTAGVCTKYSLVEANNLKSWTDATNPECKTIPVGSCRDKISGEAVSIPLGMCVEDPTAPTTCQIPLVDRCIDPDTNQCMVVNSQNGTQYARKASLDSYCTPLLTPDFCLQRAQLYPVTVTDEYCVNNQSICVNMLETSDGLGMARESNTSVNCVEVNTSMECIDPLLMLKFNYIEDEKAAKFCWNPADEQLVKTKRCHYMATYDELVRDSASGICLRERVSDLLKGPWQNCEIWDLTNNLCTVCEVGFALDPLVTPTMCKVIVEGVASSDALLGIDISYFVLAFLYIYIL